MNNTDIINILSEIVIEKRLERLNQVLNNRTRYLTIVLEDIFQTHNASAIVRSCDCFGIQDIHAIENTNNFVDNIEVTLGSSKWINVIKYRSSQNNTLDAINSLRSKGYRILATSPHFEDKNIDEIDINKGKIALLFGTELNGLSNIALENADEFVKVPMTGFTESLNVSVCAAISMYEISKKIRSSEEIDWKLNQEEKDEILVDWLKKTVKNSDKVIRTIKNRINQV